MNGNRPDRPRDPPRRQTVGSQRFVRGTQRVEVARGRREGVHAFNVGRDGARRLIDCASGFIVSRRDVSDAGQQQDLQRDQQSIADQE